MARKPAPQPALFHSSAFTRKHRRLFLPNQLKPKAAGGGWTFSDLSKEHAIFKRWADLYAKGKLTQNETSLDGDFLQQIFGDALNYKAESETQNGFQRIKQFSVPNVGTADGALGPFATGTPNKPVAVIELKGPQVDLDRDKSNGRTAVQQCFDYLNHLPGTPWGIVSNYHTIRLYHRDATPAVYEEWTLTDLLNPETFREFFYIIERGGLLPTPGTPARALQLYTDARKKQKAVGDDLYNDYSDQRLTLVRHFINDHGMSQSAAIDAAQTLIDRVVFIAFCEDRGLLPPDQLSKAYHSTPAFSAVTNPRWQNYKSLFGFIDKGSPQHGIPHFNGGLFAPNPAIDNLELDDQYTSFFSRVGQYDFMDEVNVDVLGHLFERSVTELEKYKSMGLFGPQTSQALAQMPKSAQRKRFGIYYTPSAFTDFIVTRTLGKLIESRVDTLPTPAEKVAALRHIKTIDPACGSGAFLIAAYDAYEFAYDGIVRDLRIAGNSAQADKLALDYPDYILSDNLYGVDLSEQSVEITRLSLWIRSARKGKTLADLSHNILCGNSLVNDPAVDPKHAFNFQSAFADVFSRTATGFDVVVGNPPWERLKLQEREFFSLSRPDIASATNAAKRRKLIEQLETKDPDLHAHYTASQLATEKTLTHVRTSGRFPHTAKGDVNTYTLFAELARALLSPTGISGLLIPSGIATDNNTKEFFAELMNKGALEALYDFENKLSVFPDVDGRFKFCILITTGTATPAQAADFVFFAHKLDDLDDRKRHIPLTAKDLALFNPNTRTCPIFRSRTDAEITRRIYRHVPILIDHNRKSGGNPWGIDFRTMFHQTNDAEHFKDAATLLADSFKLTGNHFRKGKTTYLPLYEAKMVQAYDHRAAGVLVDDANWMRQGQTEETSYTQHQNTDFVVTPRFWVETKTVESAIGTQVEGLLAYKDVTSSTNQRTMIAAWLPQVALMNSAPFLRFTGAFKTRRQCCLLANLNSLAYDFVARQKVGGLHLNFFVVEQLPTLPPDTYDDPCPWDKKTKLESYIADRVLRLTCTAEDMRPLALAANFKPGVIKWKEDERRLLRAELDAAFFHLYRLDRNDVEYILSTFQGITAEDDSHNGSGPTRTATLDAYDRLTP